jgi:fumarylacetoacetate (FAA) hydrolase
MRFVAYEAETGDLRSGVLSRESIEAGEEVFALPAGTMIADLLGDDGTRLWEAGVEALAKSTPVPLSDLTLRAPLPRPPTIRDFYAFEQHVATARRNRGLEMDPDWYELPVFYFSNPYAVFGPEDEVPAAPGTSRLDFELEVAAVVGRGGENLTVEEARAPGRIAGFTIMNDWSARDVQMREMRLSMGPVKGKDFATSIGPVLVTPDELEATRKDHAYDLTMTASVNGREYSRASLADIYWSFEEMLSYASRGTRVEPGDVIGSGTCGTGCILELSLTHSSDEYPWLEPGDVVELTVDLLGTLRNVVAPPQPLHPLRAGA